MGVRDFRELVCWQLSYELKCDVLAFMENGPASKDFEYRDQLKDSASSAPSNIAEGFGRLRPGDFARYLEIARASPEASVARAPNYFASKSSLMLPIDPMIPAASYGRNTSFCAPVEIWPSASRYFWAMRYCAGLPAAPSACETS